MEKTNPSDYLILDSHELLDKNIEIKREAQKRVSTDVLRTKIKQYLKKEKRIKAITVCFTDLEGKFMRLDYDKNFVLESDQNFTFDGSSIKGFTVQGNSDLRLMIDWTSFRWLPAEVFGPGKVLVFANVFNKDKTLFPSDFRGQLQKLAEDLYQKEKITINVSCEIEGILLKGTHAEENFDSKEGLRPATQSGYFHCLPQDDLIKFIDRVAEAKRSLGFENEKDHPEVAPSQFELNYKYADILMAADYVQLYKLICRQIANKLGCTATFLPKPRMNINGNGMHTNISIFKNGKNIFYDAKGKYGLSKMAINFLTAILYYAKDTCLVLNSSVNSYRRLDPKFEAPNEIKMHDCDRGSMIRIPLGNEKSTRIEVRSVAPDCNPYLTMYTLLAAGMKGINATPKEAKLYSTVLNKREKLPGNIYDALRYFKQSAFMKEIMTLTNHAKYLSLKEKVSNRSPKDLGTRIKEGEIKYHHEITNQEIWAKY